MEITSKNFLDLPAIGFDEARVIVVPFGFEATTSYGRGARNGSFAIIKASAQVELFDEELWQETYKKVKIATLKAEKPAKSIAAAKKQLGKIIGEILAAGKFPITLGGEHSITPFIIEAYKNAGFGDFSILQFDAHADLRDGYLGEKYSHACAMRRCLDLMDNFSPTQPSPSKRGREREGVASLVQVGIRSISNENDELSFWEKNQKRIKTFWAKDEDDWQIEQIVKSLKKSVYITFDVDAFDSGIMPATGTPEPGGLDWDEVVSILRPVCRAKNIIGADFVELSPIKNFSAPDFMAAKLIYKTIGYMFQSKNVKIKN